MDPKRPPLWSTLMSAVACLAILRADTSPVTQTDFDLLRNVSEDFIICFSRTFEDLTCFWEKKNPQDTEETYELLYTYKGEGSMECPLTVEELPSGMSLYVCTLPEDEVTLYSKLELQVLDAVTQEKVLSRQLYVEEVGFIDPPKNIHGTWAERPGHLQVKWEPPFSDIDVQYEVRYKSTNTSEPSQKIELKKDVPSCDLSDLRPGAWYDITIRTKPAGSSVAGFWGPWSQTVPMATAHSAGEIHLDCFTYDLEHVRCEWHSGHERPALSHKLYYKYGSLNWTMCVESGNETWKDAFANSCKFLADNKSEVFVVVNATAANREVTTYFKEPFWMFKSVRTRPPQILTADVNDDRLTLTWASPLERLDGLLLYEIGYTESSVSDWKIVLIRHAVNTTLDVHFGTQYSLKIRAIPDEKLYSGSWSAWSEVINVSVPSNSGWIMFLAALLLLLFSAAAFLLLRCTFPAMFSKLKRKIWPPVPNLHRVLDGFLAEIQKQYQPTPSLYEKPAEDNLLPCLLEILSEEKTMMPKGDSSVLGTLVKLSHSMTWPHTPVLQRRPLPEETDHPYCPQQDYVVLAPSTVSGSRYENEYCNGAVAHIGALGLFLVSVPRICPQPHDEENEHYTTFTRPWQVDEETSEGGTLWKASDQGERQQWDSAPMNTTDIANQSYLMTAGARD